MEDANVIPLYKCGNKSAAKKYCPISLTSVVSKVMERIVRQCNVLRPIQEDYSREKQEQYR